MRRSSDGRRPIGALVAPPDELAQRSLRAGSVRRGRPVGGLRPRVPRGSDVMTRVMGLATEARSPHTPRPERPRRSELARARRRARRANGCAQRPRDGMARRSRRPCTCTDATPRRTRRSETAVRLYEEKGNSRRALGAGRASSRSRVARPSPPTVPPEDAGSTYSVAIGETSAAASSRSGTVFTLGPAIAYDEAS